MRTADRLRLLALTCATGLAGCADHGSIDATPVFVNDQCRLLDAPVQEITYAKLAKVRGATLIGFDQPEGDGELRLIAVARGRKPTPGHGLSLQDVTERGDAIEISVVTHEPEQGAMLPQLITYPCLVVGIPAKDYAEITVTDQWGREIGRL